MRHVIPMRFDEVAPDTFVVADDSGHAFFTDHDFIDRYATDALCNRDLQFLEEHGLVVDPDRRDLAFMGALRRQADRFAQPSSLNYLILVPTLRCDLRCTYCQVSRVDAFKKGFDWTEAQVAEVLDFLNDLNCEEIQIEFQGGEPLLRLDILETVTSFCRVRFKACRFIVCTNLNRVDEAILSFFSSPDVYVSTSLDGTADLHERHRTGSLEATTRFFSNLRTVVDVIGADRVSALPTIDPRDPPDPDAMLDLFASYGIWSIYLRPVNHQGFARKSFSELRTDVSDWLRYYEKFIERMLVRIAADGPIFEEFTLTLAIRRALQSGRDSHVDFRNPGFPASDYLVVDFDGTLYPTDEARMLTRSGVVDLAIGDIINGITRPDALDSLQRASINNFDPDCQHCVYQPACSSDPIDDLSRYGRHDIPRPATVFCRRQTALFRLAWRLIALDDPDIRQSVCAWLGIPFTRAPLVPRHD